MNPHERFELVSVVIPARNEEKSIASTIEAVLRHIGIERALEVIVVDDASSDRTAVRAGAAGARVLSLGSESDGGNPAAARNRGAAAATGDPLIFLDADCVPAEGWLDAILAAHAKGACVVGGALDLPARLPASARCDYYCGWYLVHSRRPAGVVPHHPPPNLSVRRAAFLGSCGFSEQAPLRFSNEERAWQAELRRQGHDIYFEPKAVVFHHNRPGFRNLLRRNYRWAYTAIESKSQTESTRFPWIFRHPRLLIAGSFPLAFVHTAFVLGSWVRVGVFEPLLMWPAVLASRFAYALGTTVGGIRWLRRRRLGDGGARERLRW